MHRRSILDLWTDPVDNGRMPSMPILLLGGAVVGLLYGLFGVGSAFATPLLALMGVPGVIAITAPLPGIMPGSFAGAWGYAKRERVDWATARRAALGGVPGTMIGAELTHFVGGPLVLLLSGFTLFAVGLRVLFPGGGSQARAVARRERPVLVAGAAFAVGVFAGLLANGGGFLLVPLFLVWFGLDMNRAAGTSLVVATALSAPALLVHSMAGDVNWPVALIFGLGLVPGAFIGSRVATHLPIARLRTAFGISLVIVAVWFFVHQLLHVV
jgi:uncharacterized membrane protein YfcA